MTESLSPADVENMLRPKPEHINSKVLRDHFIELGIILVKVLPDGRDKTIAMEYLQTASMWAQSALHGPQPEIVEEAPQAPKPRKRAAKKAA